MRARLQLSVRLMVLLLATASVPFAQTSSSQPLHVQDGGSHGDKLISIFVPPLEHAPMSFVLSTQWTRPLPGGRSFTVANERRVVRDSSGRIYQERWYLAPKGQNSVMLSTEHSDPAKHVLYNCEIYEKTCYLEDYAESPSIAYSPAAAYIGALPENRGTRTRDELGMNLVKGLAVAGIREITTINVGVEGNDQPMISTREYWFSPALGINLISRLDDPRSRKQTFTVEQLSLSEPDPGVFTPPSEYKIVDERQSGAH